MTQESKKKNPTSDETRESGGMEKEMEQARHAAEAALGEPPPEGGTAAETPDNSEALALLVEGLKNENAELKDKHLRLAAEMENLRRRTARDVKDAKAYSIAAFAREMLSVSDNLRRALDAITPEQRQNGDSGLISLIEGVEMTERAMLTALEHHGVKKQEPEGKKFDPNFHQAMFEVQDPDVPSNTVVQVVQDGYVIGERVLRPAMVGISKGGPKQPLDAPQQSEGADEANAKNASASNDNGDSEPGPPNPQSEKDA